MGVEGAPLTGLETKGGKLPQPARYTRVCGKNAREEIFFFSMSPFVSI